MQKKGFTLIEIIFSLILIILITCAVLVFNLSNKNTVNKTIVEATKKIQEAANVYYSINSELDSTIDKKIYEGGSGYVLPLTVLIDKGYISNNYIKTLEDNITGFNKNEHYLLMAEFAKSTEECENAPGVIEIETSWLKTETLLHNGAYFICNYTHRSNQYHYLFLDTAGGTMSEDRAYIKPSSEIIDITLPIPTKEGAKFSGWYDGDEKIDNLNLVGSDSKILVAKWIEYEKVNGKEVKDNSLFYEIINSNYSTNCSNNLNNTGSLCMLKGNNLTDKNHDVYYYRGLNVNNYIKINNTIFRIVRTVEDNNIKIVSTESFGTELYSTNGTGFDVSNITNGGEYNMDGYSIETYSYRGCRGCSVYNCVPSSSSNNTQSWNDDRNVSLTCTKSSGTISTTVQSPIYSQIYSPLQNKFNNTYKDILDQYIINDYKWCVQSQYNTFNASDLTLKCQNDSFKTIQNPIGLLNLSEYKAAGYYYDSDKDSYSHPNLFDYTVGGWACSTSEITMDFYGDLYSTLKLSNLRGWCTSTKQMNLRPAFVINGNAKVISGNGSQSSPYVISGIV